MKFTKKPIEVEAYQITRSLLEGILFDNEPYPEGLKMTNTSYHKERREINSWSGQVTTIHNKITEVVEGDWIITEPNLINYYPCKPDIFEQTYDAAKNHANEIFDKQNVTWVIKISHKNSNKELIVKNCKGKIVFSFKTLK